MLSTHSPTKQNDHTLQPLQEGQRVLTRSHDSCHRVLDVLTKDEKAVLREIFDIFDHNGGGTIDAKDLDDTLRSVGVNLTKNQLTNVLSVIDVDRNGEIDYEGFLHSMTKTRRFLLNITAHKNEKQCREREVLLFRALTDFMKRSALQPFGEKFKHYSKQPRTIPAPHVVNDYAAGACLVGISAKQFEHRFAKLRNSSRGKRSPYANPPYSFTSRVNEIYNKNDYSKSSVHNEKGRMLRRGTIRVKIVWGKQDVEIDERVESKSSNISVTPINNINNNNNNNNKPKRKKYNGWLGQRSTPCTISDHIPLLEITKAKKRVNTSFNVDNMKVIERLRNLSKIYYADIKTEKRSKSAQHWNNLKVKDIPAFHREFFTQAFRKYTDYWNAPVMSMLTHA